MECSICLECIELGDLRVTACNHPFHKSCLDNWRQQQNTCPLCRIEIKYNVIETLFESCDYNGKLPLTVPIKKKFEEQLAYLRRVVKDINVCEDILRREIKMFQEQRWIIYEREKEIEALKPKPIMPAPSAPPLKPNGLTEAEFAFWKRCLQKK